MSAPTAEHHLEDHHLGDGERTVDPLTAIAAALATLAVACWTAAIVVHITAVHAPNAGAVVLAASLAAAVTISAVLCLCLAAARRYNRHLAAVICHHLVVAPGTTPRAGDALQAYLAGRIDRDDP